MQYVCFKDSLRKNHHPNIRDNKLFWCVAVSVHRQPHGKCHPRLPFSSGWRRLSAKPQTTREPGCGASPSRQLQPRSGFCGHLSTFTSSQSSTLSTSNQFGWATPDTLLMSVLPPGTQECFWSINWSVICSMQFLALICHLISGPAENTRLQVLKHQLHTGRHPASKSLTTVPPPCIRPTPAISTTQEAPSQPTHTSSQSPLLVHTPAPITISCVFQHSVMSLS